MSMNKIHLSPEAQDDLAEIKAYITEDLSNEKAAISVVAKITRKIRILREHALIGTPIAAVTDANSEERYLVSGKYLTFYHVEENDVFVDRVVYGGRDYLRILFDDLTDDETE